MIGFVFGVMLSVAGTSEERGGKESSTSSNELERIPAEHNIGFYAAAFSSIRLRESSPEILPTPNGAASTFSKTSK